MYSYKATLERSSRVPLRTLREDDWERKREREGAKLGQTQKGVERYKRKELKDKWRDGGPLFSCISCIPQVKPWFTGRCLSVFYCLFELLVFLFAISYFDLFFHFRRFLFTPLFSSHFFSFSVSFLFFSSKLFSDRLCWGRYTQRTTIARHPWIPES